MIDWGYLGSLVVLLVSVVLNAVVLAYRWPRAPSVRRLVDRWQTKITGRADWSWLGIGTLMVPLTALTVANLVWQVGTLHCADDSLALLASGQAVLHGQNPFVISFCSRPSLDPIPYGLPAVGLNALAALSGSVAGIWVVWQLLALAVVPLVWKVAGADRRYVSVLAATSMLYLPNIMTNIGVDNAIVPVSVLLMLLALERRQSVRRGWNRGIQGIAAFLSVARFPALFPLLGASSASGPGRWRQFTAVLGVFLGAVLVSYALWGWDAVSVVYLGEFSRNSGNTLNLLAVLVRQGWLLPSLASAGVQGGVLLALVAWVYYRAYSPRAACALPLIGVMSLSQYLNYHFLVWLLPLVFLGSDVNAGLFAYAVVAAVDEVVAEQYLGMALGIWWPYEVLGIVLSGLLLYLLIRILRDEEARIRSAAVPPRRFLGLSDERMPPPTA